jgi:hypothetical protein
MESLNKHFAALTRSVFERHGFAGSQLAGQWPEIAGKDVAAIAKPGQIKWPRSAQGSGRNQGGTLVLLAQAGRALEVHYQTPAIIERLNRFFGYTAISAIKVIQTPDQPAPIKPPKRLPTVAAKAAWSQRLGAIGDDDLKNSLARLAEQISPQGPTLNPFSTGENTGFDQPKTSSRT